MFKKIFLLLIFNLSFYVNAQMVNDFYWGCDLYVGTSFFQNNLKTNFKSDFKFGTNFHVYYKSWALIATANYGGTKLKNDFHFQNGVSWSKDTDFTSLDLGLKIGYKYIENKYCNIIPTIGISWYSLVHANEKYDPEHVATYLWFSPMLNIGSINHLKFLPWFSEKPEKYNNIDLRYVCVDLTCGILIPLINPTYPKYYKGSVIYVTLGIGGIVRSKKNETD